MQLDLPEPLFLAAYEVLALPDGEGSWHEPENMPEWRIRERMRTVAVGIVLCLNLGVDPPDAVKPAGTTIRMAGLEIGIADPAISSQKALEVIAKALQVRASLGSHATSREG